MFLGRLTRVISTLADNAVYKYFGGAKVENEIAFMALKLPSSYLWEEDATVDGEIVQKILEKLQLNSVDKRCVVAWNIDVLIYQLALKVNTTEVLRDLLFDQLKDDLYITKSLIGRLLKNKNLFVEDKIIILQKFMNNSLTVHEKKYNQKDIVCWTIELVTYYEVTKEESDFSAKKIEHICNAIFEKYFSEFTVSSKFIKDIQNKKGLIKKEDLLKFREVFKPQHESFKQTVYHY